MSNAAGNKCPNGHIMDPNWDQCPYCEAQNRSRQIIDPAEGRKTIVLTPTENSPRPERKTIVGDIPSAPRGRETLVLPSDGLDCPVTESQVIADTRKIVGVLVSYSWVPGGQIYPVREGKNYITKGNNETGESGSGYDISVSQDERMSRGHALILCRAGRYEIIDQESSNGTFLNGELLASHLSVELQNNDEIKTGSTLWFFVMIEPKTGS